MLGSGYSEGGVLIETPQTHLSYFTMTWLAAFRPLFTFVCVCVCVCVVSLIVSLSLLTHHQSDDTDPL